jgi:hypothetical protein
MIFAELQANLIRNRLQWDRTHGQRALDFDLATNLRKGRLKLAEITAPLQLYIAVPRTVPRGAWRSKRHDTHLQSLGYRRTADLKTKAGRVGMSQHDRLAVGKGRTHAFAHLVTKARQAMKDRLTTRLGGQDAELGRDLCGRRRVNGLGPVGIGHLNEVERRNSTGGKPAKVRTEDARSEDPEARIGTDPEPSG